MYLSLKRKIFYTVFTLFVMMSVLFLGMFTIFYAGKYNDAYNTLSKRNQYVMSLLHDNIILQRKLNQMNVSIPVGVDRNITNKQKELKQERTINDEMQKNFNQQYQAFYDGMKIIGVSFLLSLLSIIGLGFILQRWVITPINKLSDAACRISAGDYAHRIETEQKQHFFDEFDTLSQTFNAMMSNIENNIVELKDSERFLQLLIDAIPDGIRVIDHNHQVILSNKAYKEQFASLKKNEKCFEAYGFDMPCPHGLLNCPLREIKNPTSKSISLIQNINGHPLSVNAAPLHLKKMEKGQFLIIESIRDLSDDIRFSHQQKISSLGFLATSVAHEMKNNLGSVRMILENLLDMSDQKKLSQTEAEKYLRLVYEQVVLSAEIPERLLKLARHNIETDDIFEVCNAIGEVISLLDYELKRNGITVQSIWDDTEYKICGNEADFKMMILNIAQNAIKAMPSGGELIFSVRKSSKQVAIEIKDTGVGIPSAKIKHIFEPFYSEGQTNRAGGIGLGLAIVRSLVDKYQGKISVVSKVGVGTTFVLKFMNPKKK